ncbi:MAG: exo-alpha-sialidase [Blastocatellia bacterium]|nr:exo-alpha-sialidase [Blastocatellia bacterium]
MPKNIFSSLAIAACLSLLVIPSSGDDGHIARSAEVKIMRTPDNGIQPQAVIDDQGTLHMVYFSGDPSGGDIFYVHIKVDSRDFSAPIRVNSQQGSAIAIGVVRGPHLAIGKNGRVHVSWNGSNKAEPRGPENSSPMLYTRMNDGAFEPQRNLMQISHSLDGGGSLAADEAGNVYVAWHGAGAEKGEQHRRVWLARSTDEGKTFAQEAAVFNEETGACGCCGMRASVDRHGRLYLLYRTATQMTERGMFLLVSADQGRTFQGKRVDEWTLTSCPLSTTTITGRERKWAAWENNKQVYFAALDANIEQKIAPLSAPGETGKRKHPAIAVNTRGETLLAWIESDGWNKGGSLAWQLFDQNGKPAREKGSVEGVPALDLATTVTTPDGRFIIIY